MDEVPNDVILNISKYLDIDTRRLLGVFSKLQISPEHRTLLASIQKKKEIKSPTGNCYFVKLQKPQNTNALAYVVGYRFFRHSLFGMVWYIMDAMLHYYEYDNDTNEYIMYRFM